MRFLTKKDALPFAVIGIYLTAALGMVGSGTVAQWIRAGVLDLLWLSFALVLLGYAFLAKEWREFRCFCLFLAAGCWSWMVERGLWLFFAGHTPVLPTECLHLMIYPCLWMAALCHPERRGGAPLTFFPRLLQKTGGAVLVYGLVCYFGVIPYAYRGFSTGLPLYPAVFYGLANTFTLFLYFRVWNGTKAPKWRAVFGLLVIFSSLTLIDDLAQWGEWPEIRAFLKSPWFALWQTLQAAVFLLAAARATEKESEPKTPAEVVPDELAPLSLVWVSAFLLAVLHLVLSRLDVFDPHLQPERETLVLLCLLMLSGLGLVHGHFIKKRERSHWWRELEVFNLKQSREDLASRMETCFRQLSDSESLLRLEMASSEKLANTVKQKEERFSVLVESMKEGLAVLGERHTIEYANHAFCRMLDLTQGALVGRPILNFIAEAERPALMDRLAADTYNQDPPFETVWQFEKGFPISSYVTVRKLWEDNKIKGCILLTQDPARTHQPGSEREPISRSDPLTKLPNRNLFKERLELAMVEAGLNGHLVAVLLLDLDRFKRVNDSLGHGIGDKLLEGVGDRLLGCVGPEDIVARMSGNEFALALTGLEKSMDVVTTIDRIQKALGEPFHLDGYDVAITASIGISMFPGDGNQSLLLLKNADAAMSHVKLHGRNNYSFYTEEMTKTALQRLNLENQMRQALDRGEFEVYYQPKVDLRDGRMVGVEALVRWRHPERGLIAPKDFIAVAEETGLIVPMGEWVLETACRQAKSWQDAGLNGIGISVNISAVQFKSETLPAKILSTLARTGLQPELLELEITESLAMEDAEMSIGILGHLKTLGLRIAIDDFGTGYSSLSYLKRFPIDILKIDREFIKELTESKVEEAIVTGIIAMSHGLRLTVIAEGVETKAQVAMLTSHGCDQVQGFIIGPPVPARKLRSFLEKRSLIPL